MKNREFDTTAPSDVTAPDEAIDYSDIPEIPAAAFRTAIRVRGTSSVWDEITPEARHAARLSQYLPAANPVDLPAAPQIALDPDVASAFPDSAAVNNALRLLLQLRRALANLPA